MMKPPVPVEGLRAVPAVGVVCMRGDEVLLVRRGNPPRAGEWSIPGGRIEPGEKAADAALRELTEETGVDAVLCGLIDVVDAIFENKERTLTTRHYVLIDYAARWVGGEPVAGDDADEAVFVALDQLSAYGIWDETQRIITAGAALVAAKQDQGQAR